MRPCYDDPINRTTVCCLLFIKQIKELDLMFLQLGCAHVQIIQPLEKFRKDHIGAVKVTRLTVMTAKREREKGLTRDVALFTGGQEEV